MNLSAYEAIYAEEASQHIEELKRRLAQFEAGQVDLKGLEAARRAAHTLKGDSATMEYDALTSMAQALEKGLKQAIEHGLPLPPQFVAIFRTAVLRLEQAIENKVSSFS